MKVNDPNLPGVGQGRVGNTGLERSAQIDAFHRVGGGRKGGLDGAPTDQVSLSELSSRLRELSAESPDRVARLAELSRDVQTGRYRVDAVEVSRRLIEAALRPRE